MEEADTLQTFAEIGVALAGFTGVAVVVGRRAAGTWTYVELSELRQLLEASLAVVLLSLFPLVLARFLDAGPGLWRVCNGVAGLAGATLGIRYWLRYLRGPRETYPFAGKLIGYGTTPLVGALVVVQLAIALGLVERGASAVYLAGLFWLVMVSALNFVYLTLPRRLEP
jgi:hypothetical protein